MTLALLSAATIATIGLLALAARAIWRDGFRRGAEAGREALLDLQDGADDVVDGLRASWRRERESAAGRMN